MQVGYMPNPANIPGSIAGVVIDNKKTESCHLRLSHGGGHGQIRNVEIEDVETLFSRG
jgi:hypothetical protein